MTAALGRGDVIVFAVHTAINLHNQLFQLTRMHVLLNQFSNRAVVLIDYDRIQLYLYYGCFEEVHTKHRYWLFNLCKWRLQMARYRFSVSAAGFTCTSSLNCAANIALNMCLNVLAFVSKRMCSVYWKQSRAGSRSRIFYFCLGKILNKTRYKSWKILVCCLKYWTTLKLLEFYYKISCNVIFFVIATTLSFLLRLYDKSLVLRVESIVFLAIKNKIYV